MPIRKPNTIYAEIELKHIQIELQNNRLEHLRHFVDQYYCYKNGFVKRTGKADWNGVLWKGIVSAAARSQADPQLIVKEHVVPLKVISQLLRELQNYSLDEIKKVLDKYTLFGTITKVEDSQLRAAGLTSAMPEGFFEPGHKYHDVLLARYQHVGIKIESIDP